NAFALPIFLRKVYGQGEIFKVKRCDYYSDSESTLSCSEASGSSASIFIGLSSERECATSSSTALMYGAAASVEYSLASSTPSVTAVARSISSELNSNSHTATRIIARSTAGMRYSSQSCAKKRSMVASIVSNSSATPATSTLVYSATGATPCSSSRANF